MDWYVICIFKFYQCLWSFEGCFWEHLQYVLISPKQIMNCGVYNVVHNYALNSMHLKICKDQIMFGLCKTSMTTQLIVNKFVLMDVRVYYKKFPCFPWWARYLISDIHVLNNDTRKLYISLCRILKLHALQKPYQHHINRICGYLYIILIEFVLIST